MLEKTNAIIVQNEAKMKAKNWDVHQLLTLSSLIEEEATGFTDRQKISSVFYNRLAKGMPLQTDQRYYTHLESINNVYYTKI